MPPSDKPYKSKLLNRLNDYYIKISSQINTRFRELTYTIQGGLQKAILPLFWLWDSRKKVGQVFTSSFEPQHHISGGEKANLPHDKSAEQIIEAVHQNLQIHPSLSSLLPNKFQGVASQLQDRNIVLVLQGNNIQHILSSEQQKDIQFVVNYTLQKNSPQAPIFLRLLNFLHPKSQLLYQSLSFNKLENNNSKSPKNDVLNPSSISFKKTMNQLEKEKFNSQQKISIYKNKKHSLKDSSFFHYTKKLASKSNNISELIATFNYPLISQIVENSGQKIQTFLPFVKKTSVNLFAQGIDKLQLTSQNIHQSIEDDPFQIQILILEVFNYLFNNAKKNNLLLQLGRTEIIIIDEQNKEPWLSWSDLYGQTKPIPGEQIKSDQKDEQKENSIVISSKVKQIIIDKNSPLSESLPQGKNQLINHQLITKIDEKKLKQEAHKETIETKVIEITYEKHPLQIILEKLDQIILWLEEKIAKLITLIKLIINNLGADIEKP